MPHSSASHSWDKPFSRRNRRTNAPNLNANSSPAMGIEGRAVYNGDLHTIDVMHGTLERRASVKGQRVSEQGETSQPRRYCANCGAEARLGQVLCVMWQIVGHRAH